MLTQLDWESMYSRYRSARLNMFYKIYYGLVAIQMPLEIKHHIETTRVVNSLAYQIPYPHALIISVHCTRVLLEIGTHFLRWLLRLLP